MAIFNDPLAWTEDRIEPAARERLRAHRAAAANRPRLPPVGTTMHLPSLLSGPRNSPRRACHEPTTAGAGAVVGRWMSAPLTPRTGGRVCDAARPVARLEHLGIAAGPVRACRSRESPPGQM